MKRGLPPGRRVIILATGEYPRWIDGRCAVVVARKTRGRGEGRYFVRLLHPPGALRTEKTVWRYWPGHWVPRERIKPIYPRNAHAR